MLSRASVAMLLVAHSLGVKLAGPGNVVYTEGIVPVNICAACLAASGPNDQVERIPSGGVVFSIVSGYVAGVDVLSGSYLSIDFTWLPDAGNLTLTWLEARNRASYTISEALRRVQFQARGRDPTAKGAHVIRSISLTITDIDGDSVTSSIRITIVGRNDPPNMPSSSQPPLAYTVLETDTTPVTLFPAGSVAIEDVDDIDASMAIIKVSTVGASSGRGYVSGGDTIVYVQPPGYDVVGSWDGTTGSMTLTAGTQGATMPFTDLLVALGGIGYLWTGGPNPPPSSRRIEAWVYDASASQPGNTLPCLVPTSAIVNITAINDRPVVGGVLDGDILNYTAGSPYTLLVPSLNVTDPDDVFLSSAAVTITPASYIPGEDEVVVVAALLPSDVHEYANGKEGLAWSWDNATGSLSVTGMAPVATYVHLLRAVGYRDRVATGPSINRREVLVAVTDAGSDGHDVTNRLTSAPHEVVVDLHRVNHPPTIAQDPSTSYMCIDDGSQPGTQVWGGLVTATRDDPDDEYVYAIMRDDETGTGGSNPLTNGSSYFYIDDRLGLIKAQDTIDRSATGPAVTVRVCVWDRAGMQADPTALSACRTFTINILDLNRRPVLGNMTGLTVQVALGQSPLPGGFVASSQPPRAVALLHSRQNSVCVDLRQVFLLPHANPNASSTRLTYELEWVAGGASSSVPFTDTVLQSLFDPLHPLTWTQLSTAAPTIYCLSGRPNYGPPYNLSTAGPLDGPRPMALSLRLQVYAAGAGGRPGRPTDDLVLGYDWLVNIEIPGCRDPAARYVPCYRRGVEMTLSSTAGLHVDEPVCDNDCWDGVGDGTCDNTCDLSIDGPDRPCTNPVIGYGSTAYTSAAANPAGNFNPWASVDDDASHGCVYPHRVLSVNVTLPSASVALNNITGSDSAVTWWGDDRTPLLLPAGPWPASSASSTPLPDPAATRGYAYLRVPLGALESLVRARMGSLQTRIPTGDLNVSAAFTFTRTSWPASDLPLPPRFAITSSGPSPLIDAALVFKVSPAGMVLPSASEAGQPEVCVYAGAAATRGSLASQLDLSRRRYPRLYAAHSRVAPANGIAPGGAAGPAAHLDTTSSSSHGAHYGPLVELPSSVTDLDTGRVCATLSGRLPGLVALGWSSVPLTEFTPGSAAGDRGVVHGSSPAAVTWRATDINMDNSNPVTNGSSNPGWSTPYAGRLYFAASSSSDNAGTEVWSISPPRDDDGQEGSAGPLPLAAAVLHRSRVPRNPSWLTAYASPSFSHAPRLYFAASTSGVGNELFVFDGYYAEAAHGGAGHDDGAVPRVLSDIVPGRGGSDPASLVVHNGSLYFVASDVAMTGNVPGSAALAAPRREVWVYTDTRGTRDVQLPPRPLASVIGRWAGGNGSIDASGSLLSGYTNPDHLTSCGRWLFFAATSNVGGGAAGVGRELWAYDAGSGAAPSMVADISVGPASSCPADLYCWGDSLWFTAETVDTGRELYVMPVDGTGSGGGAGRNGTVLPKPVLVADIRPGPASSFDRGRPAHLVEYRDRLYLAADDGVHGVELWCVELQRPAPYRQLSRLHVDVTLVADISPGLASSSPSWLTVYHGVLYFSCSWPGRGREVCAYDAERPPYLAADTDTWTGTGVTSDRPMADGSGNAGGDDVDGDGQGLVVWRDRLWFAADDGPDGHGRELFALHADVMPSMQCGNGMQQVGDRQCGVVVTASDGQAGDRFGWSIALDRGLSSSAVQPPFNPWSTGSRAGKSKHRHGAPRRRPQQPGRLLVVGSPGCRSGAGCVYLYQPVDEKGGNWFGGDGHRYTVSDVSTRWPGGAAGWAQIAVLNMSAGQPADPTLWPNPFPGDQLGHAVAVHGSVVAAGAPFTDGGRGAEAGAVQAWVRLPGGGRAGVQGTAGWAHAASLSFPGHSGGARLGWSVAVHGSLVIAGAPGHAGGSGGAWVWRRDPSSGGAFALVQAITPPSLSSTSAYGCSIAIDESMLAVGACGDNAVHVWTLDRGSADGSDASLWVLDGNRSLVPCPDYNGTTCPSDAGFGFSLSLDGAYLAVGAPNYPPVSSGAVFLYAAASTGGWQPIGTAIVRPDAEQGAGTGFGSSVAVTGSPVTLVAGSSASQLDGTIHTAGHAAVLEPRDGVSPQATWPLSAYPDQLLRHSGRLRPIDAHPGDAFGWAVAVAGPVGAFSSPGDDAGRGSVYVSTCPTAPCDWGTSHFTSLPCTAGHDRVCGRCSSGPCPSGHYEASQCNRYSDRVCLPIDANTAAAGNYSGGDGFDQDVNENAAVDSDGRALLATCEATGLCDQLRAARDPFLDEHPSLGQSRMRYDERRQLEALYVSTGGWRWRVGGGTGTGGGWSSRSSDPCTGATPGQVAPVPRPWPGVVCDSDGHLVSLHLPSAGLVGALPSDFGHDLPFLAELDLADNHLTGGIPATLPRATSLRALDVSGNQLSGVLPPDLAKLPALRQVAVAGNGALLAEHDTLVSLQALRDRGVMVDVDVTMSHIDG